MIPPITKEEANKMISEAVARARRAPLPVIDVRPALDFERLHSIGASPMYEGFEEDVTRMRRGLPPLGPRE